MGDKMQQADRRRNRYPTLFYGADSSAREMPMGAKEKPNLREKTVTERSPMKVHFQVLPAAAPW